MKASGVPRGVGSRGDEEIEKAGRMDWRRSKIGEGMMEERADG